MELLPDGNFIEEDTRKDERDADADAEAEPAEATAFRRAREDDAGAIVPETGAELAIAVTDAGATDSRSPVAGPVTSLFSSSSPDVTAFDCNCCCDCCGYWLLAVKDIVWDGLMATPLPLLMMLYRPSGSGEATLHTMQVLSSSGNCGWRFMSWNMYKQELLSYLIKAHQFEHCYVAQSFKMFALENTSVLLMLHHCFQEAFILIKCRCN